MWKACSAAATTTNNISANNRMKWGGALLGLNFTLE